MKPFYVTDSAKRLAGVYPPSEVVGEALKRITREEKFGFMRLWLAEGIPFAFSGLPMIYEAVRRIGYSMSPLPAFGRPFGKHSDLDLNIIEQQLFSKLEKDYRTWKDDVDTGAVKPRNASEARHWPENIRVLRINLAMGFVDPYMIPSYFKYGTAQMIGQTAWLVLSRMKITSGAPDVRRVSVRVYRDWNSFSSRMELNLHHTLRSLVRR